MTYSEVPREDPYHVSSSDEEDEEEDEEENEAE